MTAHSPHSDSEIRDVIMAMIRELAGHRDQLTDRTRLFHDLSISGDDAGDLFSLVHKRFGTSFSGMNFEEFFPNETEGIFYRRGRFLGFGRPKRELSIGHLLAIIKQGHWVEPNT
jgi:hypothetical protein